MRASTKLNLNYSIAFQRWLIAVISFAALGLSYADEKIVIKGSDTLGAKLIPLLAEEFRALKAKDNVRVIFEIASEGSSTGIASIIDGTADLGMSSRETKGSEAAKGLLNGTKLDSVLLAKDGIAVIVQNENPLNEISSREVEKIFTGDIEDWTAINGKSGPISIYTRNTSSGTYYLFQRLALRRRDYATSSQKMAGNEQIASEVAKNANGIGYVGLAYTDTPGVKSLPIDGVMPFDKDYPYARLLYFYFDANREARPIVNEFLDFCLGAKGQRIVESVRFISVF